MATLLQSLNRSKFHGLLTCHDHTALVARAKHNEAGHYTRKAGHLDRTQSHIAVALLDEEPTAHTYYKHGTCQPTARHGVQNLTTAVGESATEAKSFISLRTVSGLNAMPTGCCIQALATNIHQAEMVAPKPVNHVEAR